MPAELPTIPEDLTPKKNHWERKHDWETLTNGSAWCLKPGEDFTCGVRTFRNQCHLEARRRNLKSITRWDKAENKFWVQFFGLVDSGSPEGFAKASLEDRVTEMMDLLQRIDQSIVALRAELRRAPVQQASAVAVPASPFTVVVPASPFTNPQQTEPKPRNTSMFQFGSGGRTSETEW